MLLHTTHMGACVMHVLYLYYTHRIKPSVCQAQCWCVIPLYTIMCLMRAPLAPMHPYSSLHSLWRFVLIVSSDATSHTCSQREPYSVLHKPAGPGCFTEEPNPSQLHAMQRLLSAGPGVQQRQRGCAGLMPLQSCMPRGMQALMCKQVASHSVMCGITAIVRRLLCCRQGAGLF